MYMYVKGAVTPTVFDYDYTVSRQIGPFLANRTAVSLQSHGNFGHRTVTVRSLVNNCSTFQQVYLQYGVNTAQP